MRFIIPILLLLSTEAMADRGVSFLGFDAFDFENCTKALATYEGVKRPWVAMLWGSFGVDHACRERFLALPQKKKRLQIYIDNGTCSRSGRKCSRYDRPNFTKRTKQIAEWIRPRLMQAEFWVIMRLEDDDRTATVAKKRKIMRGYLPRGVKLGRNPNVKTTYFDGFDIAELHGLQRFDFPSGKIRVLSNDGIDVDFGSKRLRCAGSISKAKLLTSVKRTAATSINNLLWWQSQGGCADEWRFPFERRLFLYSADVHVVNKILRGIL